MNFVSIHALSLLQGADLEWDRDVLEFPTGRSLPLLFPLILSRDPLPSPPPHPRP